MKAIKIIYWITTTFVALMMAFSVYTYLTKAEMQEGFHHLGFPDYFRIELAIAKALGVIVLLAPIAARVKEWAYAGFAFTFISAFIAHTASGDPVANAVGPVIALVILAVSYITFHKLQAGSQRTSAIIESGKTALN